MAYFLLYLFTFIVLRKKGIHSNLIDFFFLLYPSFLLYSSLALRETLITFLMIFAIYFYIIKKNKLYSLLFSLPLFLIKIQNFLIFLLTVFVYSLLKKKSTLRYTLFFVGALFLVFMGDKIPFVSIFIERLDLYRYNLIAENFGYNWDLMETYDYQPFSVGFSMIPLMFKSFVYMLFKPFPWEATNLVQFIQSIENVVTIGLIIFVLKNKVHFPVIKEKILFLNIFLLISMTIYGLVSFNFGTAARFRFSFIVIYLVYYLFLIKSDRFYRNNLFFKYS